MLPEQTCDLLVQLADLLLDQLQLVSSRSPFAKMNIVGGSILAAVEFAALGISMTFALGTGGSGVRDSRPSGCRIRTGVVTASALGCSYPNGSSYGTKYGTNTEPKRSWWR